MKTEPTHRKQGIGLRWVPVVSCAVLAMLTMVLGAHEPSYDPWSWLVWARQLSGTSLVPFDSMGASGWKPFPVLVQLPFNWFGPGVAPFVWVWIVRTGTFMIPVVAWRLGRLASGYPAAVLAALASLMVPGITDCAGGLMEPLVALFLLMAVEQEARGRSGWAWLLGVLAVLGRPEALAAVAPFGLWLMLKRRLAWYWFVLGLALASLLWIIGDWIGRGKPLALLGRATESAEPLRVQAAEHPGLEILHNEIFQLSTVALATLAFLAALRWKEPIARMLGLIVLLLGGSTAIATELGYPGVTRYLWPLVPILCVMAGLGLGRLANLVRPTPGKVAATLLGVVLLLGLLGPSAIKQDRAGWDWYLGREAATNDMPNAIAEAGGRGWLVTCGSIVVAPSPQVSAGAYALDVKLTDVARGGISAVHAWESPQVVLVEKTHLSDLQVAVRERGLRTAQLGSSRLWVVYWVGSGKEVPCRRGRLTAAG